MLYLLASMGAPLERSHNKKLSADGTCVTSYLTCLSSAVEMPSQVCNNMCNNPKSRACPSMCRCTVNAAPAIEHQPIGLEKLARLVSRSSFRRLTPKKKVERNKQGVKSLDNLVGYYAPTWGYPSLGPDDATASVAFSGWNDIKTAIKESGSVDLKGMTFLSLGGSSEQGTFNPDTVQKMGKQCELIKKEGYDGVVFDIEVTRGGQALLDALDKTYGKCKDAGLTVMVTTSHSAPTGVSLGVIREKLIDSWVASDNIDIISPQLYSWGGEEDPEFATTWPCDNCTWTRYAGSKAKMMPSVVEGSHLKVIKKFFAKKDLPVDGYFQWKPVLSKEDQEAADKAAKEQEEYDKEHADDEPPPEEEPPKYAKGESPTELAIKDDVKQGWLTQDEADAAFEEYEEMHAKGWLPRQADTNLASRARFCA